MAGCETATRGTTNLNCLQAVGIGHTVIVNHPSANVVHDRAERGAERDFNQARIGYVPGEGKGLGTGRAWCTELGILAG